MAADTLFFFGFDKSDLSQEALDDLDAHAKYLASVRAAKVRLEGHADERGTEPATWRLVSVGRTQWRSISLFKV